MATSGRINTSRQSGVNFYLRWTEKSQSVTDNETVINWYAGINSSGTTYWYSNAIRIDGGSINGSSIGTGTYSNITANGDYQLKSGTKTIGHNSDGTKTFSYNITGWLYANGSASASGSSTLDTIPRNSQVSTNKSSYTLGEAITIYTNRKSSSFTHRIRIRRNNSSGTIIEEINNVGSSTTWTPNSTDIATMESWIPNSTTLTLYIESYNNQVGAASSVSRNQVIADANPTFDDFTYEDTNASTIAITGNNQYIIQGQSTLRAIIASANKAEAIKSATMSKYTFNVAGISVEQAYSTDDINKDIGAISASTDQSLTVTAVDSRGLTKAVSKTVSVVPYTPVVITASAVRENNFEATTTVKIKGVMSLLSVGGVTKNAVNTSTGVAYRYREAGGTFGSWTNRTSSTSGVNVTTSDFTLNLDNTKQYEIEVRITDKLATTTKTLVVNKGVPILMISTDKESLAIGKTPVTGRKLDVGGDIYANNKKVHDWDTIAFSAYRSASYGFGAGEYRKIAFNVAELNVGGSFSTSTNQFTAPVAGLYQFNMVLHFQNSKESILAVYKNGSMYRRMSWIQSPSTETKNDGHTGAIMMSLAAGDTVYVCGYTYDACDVIGGFQWSSFDGCLVAPM